MTQAYSNPERENDPHALPDIEVFYMASDSEQFEAFGNGFEPGWYWCLSDSEPNGPFKTEAEALADAQEVQS